FVWLLACLRLGLLSGLGLRLNRLGLVNSFRLLDGLGLLDRRRLRRRHRRDGGSSRRRRALRELDRDMARALADARDAAARAGAPALQRRALGGGGCAAPQGVT